MKNCLLLLLLLANAGLHAQQWEAELMTGAAAYSGDLTQPGITYRTLRPAAGINLRYNFRDHDEIVLRGGLTWATLYGSDRYNRQKDLRNRNLDFRSQVWEASMCVEFNIFEPEYFTSYPYFFAGIGIFHFNPYTYDRNGEKQFLQPLGTEGQGLASYPDRKPYSLTQFCIPFGGGMKVNISRRCDLAYELGGRFLFTDYLDDVSKTYVNTQELMANARPKSAELAYRQLDGSFPNPGDIRGNPKARDWYFVNGLKLIVRLGR